MLPDDRSALDELHTRLRILLPEDYQETYESMEPVPMRSAGLLYASDGSVAWDRIWGSFCDLAMAGGPPHKGALLQAGTSAEIDAHPDRYRAVTGEICRGLMMVADLPAGVSPVPGHVRMRCFNESMAGWLLRAITMENVAVRADGHQLDLPAAPSFRLEKEIKNVITVVAKTCHYYSGHMPRTQRQAIAVLIHSLGKSSPLIVPAASARRADDEGRGTEGTALSEDAASRHRQIASRIETATGLRSSDHAYAGWLGLQCESVRLAIWMMRALVATNILSRREEQTLFVPVNEAIDPNGDRVCAAVARLHRLAVSRVA